VDRGGVDLVELGRRVVGRARPLVAGLGLEGRRGRDQGNAGPRERGRERSERAVGEGGPAVRGETERLIVLARAIHVADRHVVRGGELDPRAWGSRRRVAAHEPPNVLMTSPRARSVSTRLAAMHGVASSRIRSGSPMSMYFL